MTAKQKTPFDVQTRSVEGELNFFPSLKEAFEYIEERPDVWKVSFPVETGERVRLVRRSEGWVYEDILIEVLKRLKNW